MTDSVQGVSALVHRDTVGNDTRILITQTNNSVQGGVSDQYDLLPAIKFKSGEKVVVESEIAGTSDAVTYSILGWLK